ncbi:MAG: hypothetical protein F6K36_13135 [Symploca sp. SIO3C6]|uniref:Uncharacterized protein n=1 Tax=Symploca sp. SIO1C4 TaxID=2607765 RepID=A0A6B3NBM9_9CYAN|nr:hypothetical protein [Symploca sp. SIO3C6]NER28325.1 hypothetical protein [Symploca sp. SIO1C4]
MNKIVYTCDTFCADNQDGAHNLNNSIAIAVISVLSKIFFSPILLPLTLIKIISSIRV